MKQVDTMESVVSGIEKQIFAGWKHGRNIGREVKKLSASHKEHY